MATIAMGAATLASARAACLAALVGAAGGPPRRRRNGMARRGWAALALVGALYASGADAAPSASAPVGHHSAEVGDYVGLSDLAFDGAGGAWTVPERQPALLPLALDRNRETRLAGPAVPIDGLPPHHDIEALAWIDADTVALGTESEAFWRRSDAVLVADVADGRARVVEKIPLPWGLWKLRARANQGIEGMCFAAGQLLAAGESTGRLPDGRRAAPLGRLDWARRQWTPLWLALTSRTGKVSALTCRHLPESDALEVLAIERHFETCRLLRFLVPMRGPSQTLTPEIWRDLGAEHPSIPNLEGIARAPDDTIWLISDNHYGRVTGPTEVWFLPPP